MTSYAVPNRLDGGAHFYDTYATKDGKFMAVGALEPQFYKELLLKLDSTPDDVPQHDYENGQKFLENKFKEKTQSEWCEVRIDKNCQFEFRPLEIL